MLLPFLAASVLTLAAAPAQGATAAQPVATPVAAAAPAAAPAADANKRICRRFAATGSLIPSRRECRTSAEWDRLAEAAQKETDNLTERARAGMAGN